MGIRRLLRDENTDAEWRLRTRNAVNALIDLANLGAGTTAERPTTTAPVGGFYWDTTLGCPVWWTGSIWVKCVVVPA